MERVLGVLVGISTVCLILSIIASHLQEVIAAYTARRAKGLEATIRQMLGDPKLVSSFFDHPLIQGMSFSKGSSQAPAPEPRPTYIAADVFRKVLLATIDSVHRIGNSDPATLLAKMPDSKLKIRLQTVTQGAVADVTSHYKAIEKWYDDTMDRVNGLYKRKTQAILFAIGLCLAVVFNANLINITSALWTSSSLRGDMTALAQQALAQPDACKDQTDDQKRENCKYAKAREELNKFAPLPLGYKDFDWHKLLHPTTYAPKPAWFVNVTGWLMMAVAISFGAPFWFDLLNQVINVRMAGTKPPRSDEAEVKKK